jgi:hypothetical protein
LNKKFNNENILKNFVYYEKLNKILNIFIFNIKKYKKILIIKNKSIIIFFVIIKLKIKINL